MKKYQIALLSFALGIFAVTWLGVYLIKKTNQDILTPQASPTTLEYRTILIFFPNNQKDPLATDCETTYSVERAVNRLSDNSKSALGEYAYLALSELLKGPAGYEKNCGFYTLINEGTKIQHIVIEGGIARADFNEKLNEGIAGSCKVQAIRSQITETLMQFPGVDNVIISVNGNSEEILQP